MSELDIKLRQLAANGEFTYLSMIPVAGATGVTFAAQVSPASRFGHSEGRDADPVKAILKAIDGLPKSFATAKPERKRKEFGDPSAPPPTPSDVWDIL